MRGGCQAPIAAYAVLEGEQMTLRVAVGLDRLREMLRGTRRAKVTTRVEAESLGTALAAEIGAARLELAPLDGQIFLLARTQGGASRIAPALREAGAEVIEAYNARSARQALDGRSPDVILFPSSRSVGVIGDFLEDLRARASAARSWPPWGKPPAPPRRPGVGARRDRAQLRRGVVRRRDHALHVGAQRRAPVNLADPRREGLARLVVRPRRLRSTAAMRDLVRETRSVEPAALVQPLFVVSGKRVRTPISSMPGVARLSVDAAVEECRSLDAVWAFARS